MEPPGAQQYAASILVVDDSLPDLELLSEMLKERGYRARPVPSGDLALQAAKSNPPDLILLDIHMPEMDGYEVCERLKADEKLQDIPVLFISGLSEIADKVRAFQIGGADYITKPFQFEEVEARVATHLELRRQRRQLRESYEQLQKLEGLRDDLTHMLVHDLKNPLVSASLALNIFRRHHESGQDRTEQEERDQEELLRVAGESNEQLERLIEDILDVARAEASGMPLSLEDRDLAEVVRAAAGMAAACTRRGEVNLSESYPEKPLIARFDPGKIRRVVDNLLENALKYTPSGGHIAVEVRREQEEALVSVRDDGEGIAPELQALIFEKFGQVEAARGGRRMSVGLGLAFVSLAVSSHHGRIWVESAPGRGATFTFALPLASPETN